MALNLADRLVIMNGQAMQTRVTAAVIQFALYLLGGNPTAPQAAWAKGAADNPPDMARKVAVHVLSDTNFLAVGSDVTDAQLQGAVEAAVNARFIASA